MYFTELEHFFDNISQNNDIEIGSTNHFDNTFMEVIAGGLSTFLVTCPIIEVCILSYHSLFDVLFHAPGSEQHESFTDEVFGCRDITENFVYHIYQHFLHEFVSAIACGSHY